MQTYNKLYLRPDRSRQQVVNAESKDNIHFLAFCLSGLISIFLDVIFKLSPSWISSWVKWCPTSSGELEMAENSVLSNLRKPYKAKYVNIGHCWENEDQLMWTVRVDPVFKSFETPLVLLHGFASGIGLWLANLESLSVTRPVYAFDMLGFARSSRPVFSSDAAEAEQQFVTGIEMWRRAVGLERMIFLAHDMGGFLATSYAIRHPNRVERLILVDPWGFPERPIKMSHKYEMPNWVKFVNTFISNFNLLAILRASGPLGPYLVDLFRRDLQKKYSKCLTNKRFITNYLYHCNSQQPSGEVGFKAMTDNGGWPLYPMISRIAHLDDKIPMVFVYGSRTWVNRQPALQIKYSRLDSYVGIKIVDNAGHYVYADQPEPFNSLINRICDQLENSDSSS